MGDLRHVPSGLGRLSSQSTIYGPDNACLLPTTATGSDCEARVDPDITGTGTGPTTSESTPPAHATRATRPATYLSTRWGTDGHGSAGLPEISEDRADLLCSMCFMCVGPLFVSPYTTTVESRVTCNGHS
jgi:hypothetical protein